MKIIIRNVLLLLFFSQYCLGQSKVETINESWVNLKNILQKRTDLSQSMTNLLSQSKTVDKVQLKNTNTAAEDLATCLKQTKIIDSVSLRKIQVKNNLLTKVLTKTMINLVEDTIFKKREDVLELFSQLEGTENRIAYEIIKYNQKCKENHRFDLIYQEPVREAPKVIF